MKVGKLSDLIGFFLIVLLAIIGIFFIITTARADEWILGAFDKKGKCVDYGTYDLTHASDKAIVVPEGVTELEGRYLNSVEECK